MGKSGITRRGFIWGGILGLVAAFSYGINLNKGGHIGAVITQNDKVIKRIDDLDKVEKPYTISVSGDYHNLILVEKGRIRFEKSDCPNQICVHTGWLTKYGDIAVCMPNKAIISIEKD
jgi:hypothetical protein